MAYRLLLLMLTIGLVGMFDVRVGDCRALMAAMDDNSVDSVVCDPPYELNFMGKGWDASGIAYDLEVWKQAFRVLKPGGHLLAFSGSRTYHRMVVAIEDAGFEIRDQIMWLYGSGFPKSHDVSKGIDKAARAERTEVVGKSARHGGGIVGNGTSFEINPEAPDILAPATPEAQQWQGWGTALKPAHEPICVARKPLAGTVAENVLQHGTGAINVDGCRIGTKGGTTRSAQTGYAESGWRTGHEIEKLDAGRWPANIIHDGSDEVVGAFPTTGGNQQARADAPTAGSMWGIGAERSSVPGGPTYGYSGSAARFFYSAKASVWDRDGGLQDLDTKASAASEFRPNHTEKAAMGEDGNPYGRWNPRKNIHPTVKPTDLMRYLCRLVTPPDGTVLDPFTGSGSTGRGAILEGFNFIGCELSEEYAEIARERIAYAQKHKSNPAMIRKAQKPSVKYDIPLF